MNILRTVGLLIGSFFIAQSIQAYIVSAAQWQFPKNTMTVVGDMHVSGALGKSHFDIIQKALKHWKHDTKRRLVILEASAFYAKQLENPENRKKQNDTLFDLILFAYEHKNKYGNIDFIFGDIRGQAIKGWQTLHSFFHEKENLQKIANILIKNNTQTIESLADLDALMKKNPQAWEQFDTIFSLLQQNPFWQITYLELLKEIRNAHDIISAFIKQVKEPELSDVLKQYAEILTKKFDELKNFTTRRNEPFMRIFLDEVREKKSFAYLSELFNSPFLPTWQTMADAGFWMEFITNKDAYDEILLVAGDRHAKAFKQVLKTLASKGNVILKKEDLEGPLSSEILASFLQ